VANTGVLYWGNKLYALWEVGRPYELQPHTLDTVGESDLGGQLGQRLAGHYRLARERDGTHRCVAFGAQVSLAGSHLEFYEMDPSGAIAAKSKYPLNTGSDIMFVHDMLVTDHWYVVLMGPMRFDMRRFFTEYAASRTSLAELLVYDKAGRSQILFYPRPGKPCPPGVPTPPPNAPVVVPAPPAFSFHHVNAYEEDGGRRVVLDTIVWQDMALDVTQHNVTTAYYQGGCRTQLVRMTADMVTRRLASCERVVQRTLEFPAINNWGASGRPYQYAYCAADAVDDPKAWAPAQALLKIRIPRELGRAPPPPHAPPLSALGERAGGDAPGVVTSEWRPGPRCFVNEPFFVPRSPPVGSSSGASSNGSGGIAGSGGEQAEDDGWIIVGVHDAEVQRAHIAILDAQRIEEGPVASIALPHALPPGLHGCWAPDYLGPDPNDLGVPKWREPNRIRQL